LRGKFRARGKNGRKKSKVLLVILKGERLEWGAIIQKPVSIKRPSQRLDSLRILGDGAR